MIATETLLEFEGAGNEEKGVVERGSVYPCGRWTGAGVRGVADGMGGVFGDIRDATCRNVLPRGTDQRDAFDVVFVLADVGRGLCERFRLSAMCLTAASDWRPW